MLYTLLVLMIFQCLGEAAVFLLRWNIPGAVMGMLLLFFALLASPRLMKKIEESSHHLLKHMSLFFIPAGVGIMVSASSIAQHWLALLLAIVVSTLLTLAVTAASMRVLMGHKGDHDGPVQDPVDQATPPKPDS
ncbi:CidA/LrgA family protein [Undibacterium sp. Di24W]|uniref:CidA/LrgA family protein n=1 Tax=Undibacterium sp. Di24W TaxID=3413033 RepID=UPI003BF1896E